MITNETVWNLRVERNVLLPTNKEYEIPRIKEIATRQRELLDEFTNLDKELLNLVRPLP